MDKDNELLLAKQLACATDIDAVFCIACGQPDEDSLHDPKRCPQLGGQKDQFPISEALEAYDQSCNEEPYLDEAARAIHCAIVAVRMYAEDMTGPKVGDGTPDAALAISEHAFRAGFGAAIDFACSEGFSLNGTSKEQIAKGEQDAWDDYEPSEEVKALS